MLVADKLTAHRLFEQQHRQLTEKAKAGAAVALEEVKASVDNFALNQLIYEELNHYEEFGEVLGKHPKLWKLKLAQEVNKLSEAKALKRRNNLRTYISRDRKKVKKMKGEARTKFSDKLEMFRIELELLEQKYDF